MTRFTAPSIWLPGFDPEPLELLAPTIGSAFETDDVELADDSRVALGRILEPSAGIGHFIGAMPRHMAQRSSVTAIEIDRLSGRMLKALYAPAGEELRLSPFEKTSLAGNWFDLAIGNVPFGRYQVADTCNRAYARFSIHNYFFGRALDLVRPGGLVCFITSSHTMEAQAESVRAYIAAQAQMLGAIRLPKGTFACLASTGVQTDILFLRKRRRAEPAEADWLQIGIVPDSLRHPHCHERYLPINGWYVNTRSSASAASGARATATRKFRRPCLKVIAALEKKTALHAQDLARLEPQTMQIISLEITGRRIAGPDAVGDALRWLVKAAKEEVRSGSWSIERIVGRFGGFELGLLTERGETVPRLHLSSRCVYNAESYQTGPAWVAGIVAALESVPNTTPTPPHSWRCGANGWTTSGWNWPARSSMRTAWRSRSRGSDSC